MTIYPVSGYATAKFTVSATPGFGTHTTITAATAAASVGDTIFIRPGTYSESFTAKDGVDYVAYGPNLTTFPGDSDVIINGTVTLPNSTSSIGFQNITFQASSGFCITDGGATGNFFEFANCSFLPAGSGAISQSGDNQMYFWDCNMSQDANSVPLFSSANGNIFIFGGSYTNNGFTSATCTFAGTKLLIFGGTIDLPLSMSGSNTNGNLEMYNVSMQGLGNQVAVTLANSRVAIISNCFIFCGNQAAISAGAGTTADIYNCTVETSAANAFTGAGSINYGGITFTSTSTTNVTSETYAPLTVKQGGTGASSETAHGVLLGQGTGSFTATSVGATGTVLSGNTGADPTFQTIGAVGGITSITGNSGGAESPSSGNFNILGTGSITVAGSANTETVQLTGLTSHDVLIGAGTATIGLVAPSAISGVPLISQGAAADPVFGTAVVAGGGTGAITLTGVLTGNGTSAVTASTVTQHGVIVGGASNAVSSTAVGSTGQVLQANTGADPTYSTATYPSTAGTSGNILTSNGTNWTSSAPPSGFLVQQVRTQSTTPDSTASNYANNATPTTSNGKQYFSLAITPKNTANILVIEVMMICDVANTQGAIALFQDAGTNAITTSFSSNPSETVFCLTMRYSMTAGTTSATTFKVRYGANSGSMFINQNSAGADLYGGSQVNSFISITEYTS